MKRHKICYRFRCAAGFFFVQRALSMTCSPNDFVQIFHLCRNRDAIKWYQKRTQLYIFIIMEAGIYRLNFRAIDMIGRDVNSLDRDYVSCESEWLIVDDRVAQLEHWAISVGFLLLLLVFFAAHTALSLSLLRLCILLLFLLILFHFLAQPAHLSVYLSAR